MQKNCRENLVKKPSHSHLFLVYAVMTALTAVLLGLAFILEPERLLREITQSIVSITEVLPIVAFSIFTAAVVTAGISPQFIQKWTGNRRRIHRLLIAAAAGTLIPCEPLLGLPLILGIARSGADLGFIITLLTSSKLFSFMRLPDYFTFLDYRLAVVFLACTVVMPILSGMIAAFFNECKKTKQILAINQKEYGL